MTDPRHLANQLVDDRAVDRAARRVAATLAAMHAFADTRAAAVYPREVRRLAWRAATAVAELLEVAEAARAREEVVR